MLQIGNTHPPEKKDMTSPVAVSEYAIQAEKNVLVAFFDIS